MNADEIKPQIRELLDEQSSLLGALRLHPEDDELLHHLAVVNDELLAYHNSCPFWYHECLKEKGLVK